MLISISLSLSLSLYIYIYIYMYDYYTQSPPRSFQPRWPCQYRRGQEQGIDMPPNDNDYYYY